MAIDETILLHFDIDEQPAVNSIKDLRQANSQLRAERDKVNISTKEGQELVQKLNVTIDKNNKLIKDNSSALEKQRQNVGNYSKSIQEAAGNLNIMGTNVGQLSSKLTSFVNPVTAAVGVLGALGAAYARSSIGAKDLEFASNQLAFATTILTDKFAGLFSSAEDGEGILSKLLGGIIFSLDRTTAIQSKIASQALENLESIGETAGLVQAAINERLAENAELMTDISNTETDINKKRQLALKVQDNIRDNALERLAIINQEIDQQTILLGTTEDKGKIEGVINRLKAEQTRVTTQETKSIEKVNKLLNSSINAENKRVESIKNQNDELKIQQKIKGIKPGEITGAPLPDLTNAGDQEIKLSDKITGVVVKNNETKGESAEEYVNRLIELNQQEAAAARDLAGALAAIANEGTEAQKALALVTIAINAGIGVSEAVKAGAGIPFPANLAAILSGVTAVLAGIAQARNLLGGAAAGGGDFVTTKPTLLMVGDNPGGRERVTVEPLSGRGKTQVNPRSGLLQMAGGGSLTVNDGGFVANTNLQPAREAMLIANMWKNMPPIYASWTEGRKVGKRIEFKEKVTRQ